MRTLVAMSFGRPVRPRIEFRGFEPSPERRLRNAWGIAYYPDRSQVLLKELRAGPRSHLNQYLASAGPWSSTFLLHAASLDRGTKRNRNAAPFQRELNGREYVFALSGDVQPLRARDARRFRPVGESPSEEAFCRLLNAIDERGVPEWDAATFDWLKSVLGGLGRQPTYSCVFTEGTHLFAYRGERDPRGLGFARVPVGFHGYIDDDFRIEMPEPQPHPPQGYIVARPPPTPSLEWSAMEPGELVVFREGELVHFT